MCEIYNKKQCCSARVRTLKENERLKREAIMSVIGYGVVVTEFDTETKFLCSDGYHGNQFLDRDIAETLKESLEKSYPHNEYVLVVISELK